MTLEAAIARSVSHNEIVTVEVDGNFKLDDIATLATVDTCDHVRLEDYLDVWGDNVDGTEWRLRVVTVRA